MKKSKQHKKAYRPTDFFLKIFGNIHIKKYLIKMHYKKESIKSSNVSIFVILCHNNAMYFSDTETS